MQVFADFGTSILLIIKGVVLLFLFLYIVFASVVIRQVRVMTETLQVGFERPLKLLALTHFLFALFVFILSIIIL